MICNSLGTMRNGVELSLRTKSPVSQPDLVGKPGKGAYMRFSAQIQWESVTEGSE